MPDRWMTYGEAGELFGMSAEAVRKRSRRLRWQVQPPNGTHGKARILVPENAELPLGRPPGIPSDNRPDDREARDELLAELRRRAEAAEAAQAAAAQELAELHQRLGQAEGEGRGLREALTLAQATAAERLAERDAERRRADREAGRAGQEAEARQAAETAAAAAQAAQETARSELAAWQDGNAFVRALRSLMWRRMS